MAQPEIKQVIIYPSIGVARVGNSPEEYFVLPDQANMPIKDKDDFRDKHGNIKRQAARFRLFGADAKGNIIRELTPADGDITWTVQVANKKAGWYNFDVALDIPLAQGADAGYPAVQSTLRNATIQGDDRKRLYITPDPVSISGLNTNQNGVDQKYAFDTGTFYSLTGQDTSVYLGELRTDKTGNLLFLGGRGKSASYSGLPAVTFANNDTWHDDTSDGPVDAEIKMKNGKVLKAKGAWVLTAPPDYSPGVQAFVTGFDLLAQAAKDMKKPVLPKEPTFWEHIYPMLERMTLNGWVNNGVFKQYGWGSPADLTTPEMIAKLESPNAKHYELRQSIFRWFRNPDYKTLQAELFPPVYGDGIQGFLSSDTDPMNFMAVLPFQYEYMRLWADGKFTKGKKAGSTPWNKLTGAEQAQQIDRAILDETIGGPFHPGCEFTWPMRVTMMYSEPFRIKRRNDAPLNYGPILVSQMAMAEGGPLDGSGPGDLTKWMAVPWQTDTSSCLSGYYPMFGQYVPTFWPVRVPNDVLTEEDYKRIMDKKTSLAEKNDAFANREKWLRGVVYKYGYPAVRVSPSTVGINDFIKVWHEMGILIEQEGPGDSNFPKKMWVENGRTVHADKAASLKAPKAQTQAERDSDSDGYLWMVDRITERNDRR